jgi:hypothetical protein
LKHWYVTSPHADNIYDKPIIEDIWKSINEASIILIGTNGSESQCVLWNIAHKLVKTVILITQNIEDVPFDLRLMYYYGIYSKRNSIIGNKFLASNTINNILDPIKLNPSITAILSQLKFRELLFLSSYCCLGTLYRNFCNFKVKKVEVLWCYLKKIIKI